MRRVGISAAALALACALGAVGCGRDRVEVRRHTPATTTPSASTTSGTMAPVPGTKVAVIVLENEELAAVYGNHDAPYLNQLAHDGAVATNWFAIRHPSLPNYLALIGGSTFGVTSDCTDCTNGSESVVDQFEAARVSWKAYMESMPSPCYLGGSAGRYAKKHNPFVYFTRVTKAPDRCAKVVPFDQLAADEQAGALPQFSFISPDLCDDGHDCGIPAADQFVRRTAPALLSALGPHGLLVVTFDEGTTNAGCCGGHAAGGRVLTIFAGPLARSGTVATTPLDHLSLLRTIDDLFGVPHLADAGCSCTPVATPMLAPT